MNRRKPLQRSSSLSGSRGKKRGPSMKGFWAQVTSRDGRCQLAHLGGCAGHLDAHHWIKAQRLSDVAKADPRNGVALCRRHHDAVHSPFKPVVCPRPPLLGDFLNDHGLLESGRPDPRRKAA